MKNYVSNKDETARMFESDLMEALSRVHPAVPVIIYLPLVCYLLYNTIYKFHIGFINILVLFLFGAFVWTITEYSLHRFIFHWELKSEFGKRIHFIFHGVHHDYPSDSRRLVMPPSVSIPLAVIFYFLFKLILGDISVLPFFAGFLIGYLFYDMTHYAVHHFPIRNRFWLMLKKHHMKHHYQNSNLGYGVSSPLWDKVIGTDFPDNKIIQE
jgi:sterol desaturase/sphingolipid hydroxylase (fatty acid hydroxylase superfamily)